MTLAKQKLDTDYFPYNKDIRLKYGQDVYCADAYGLNVIKSRFRSFTSDGKAYLRYKGKDLFVSKDEIYVKQINSYPIANFDKYFSAGVRHFELLLHFYCLDHKTKHIYTKDFLLHIHHKLKIDFDRLKRGFEDWMVANRDSKYSFEKTSEIFIIKHTNSERKQFKRTRVFPIYKGSYISHVRIIDRKDECDHEWKTHLKHGNYEICVKCGQGNAL